MAKSDTELIFKYGTMARRECGCWIAAYEGCMKCDPVPRIAAIVMVAMMLGLAVYGVFA